MFVLSLSLRYSLVLFFLPWLITWTLLTNQRSFCNAFRCNGTQPWCWHASQSRTPTNQKGRGGDTAKETEEKSYGFGISDQYYLLRDDTDTQDFWTRFFDAAIVKVSEPIRYPRIVGESESESMHSQRGSTTLFTLYSSDELLVFSSLKLINTNPNLSPPNHCLFNCQASVFPTSLLEAAGGCHNFGCLWFNQGYVVVSCSTGPEEGTMG